MIEILFRLFVKNSIEELRRTVVISSLSQNNRHNNYSHCFETTNLLLDTQLIISILKTVIIMLFVIHPNKPKSSVVPVISNRVG
jgi:hypothetical protein